MINDIKNYIESQGYTKVDNNPNITITPSTFVKGDVTVKYDTFFGTTFKVFKGNEEFFDINREKREVLLTGSSEGSKVKSIGVPYPITLDEVKNVFRDLKLSDILDENE